MPCAAFRSVWVADGNADVDHLLNVDGDVLTLSEWAYRIGSWWPFHRRIPGQHNTSAPDLSLVTQDLLPELSSSVNQTRFQPLPSAMPARPAPAGFGVDRRMRADTPLAMGFMPHAPRSPAVCCRRRQRDRVSPTANSAPKCRPPYPIEPGKLCGSVARRCSQGRREGNRPCSHKKGRSRTATASSWSRRGSKAWAV